MKNIINRHKENIMIILGVVLLFILISVIFDLMEHRQGDEKNTNVLKSTDEQPITDEELKDDGIIDQSEVGEEEIENDRELINNKVEESITGFENETDFTSVPSTNYNKTEEYINLESDTDEDGAKDYIEDYFGTDKTKTDTDEDGLSDFIELYSLVLEPLNVDTDGNGVLDCDEDLDGDGLNNLQETLEGTNIIYLDTDKDGLSDYDEVIVHNTNPLVFDTDEDGVSDAKEIEMGVDPLNYEKIFNVVVEAKDEDSVKASVEIALSGEQVETLKVERYDNTFLFPTTMPGYIGGAYEFYVDGDIETATIKFEFDESLLETENFEPIIYFFNEEKQVLEEMETVLDSNVASTEVTHFSKYILLNKSSYFNGVMWLSIAGVTGYSSTKVVFLISETDSIRMSDSAEERYKIVEDTIEQLPLWCGVGIVKYNNGLLKWNELFFDREYAKECVRGQHLDVAWNVGFAGYCDGTSDYAVTNLAIREAIEMYSNKYDSALKIFVVIGENRASDSDIYSSVLASAKAHNIKVYSVDIKNNSDEIDTMGRWSEDAGGKHYYVSDILNTDKLSNDVIEEMYKDTDKDGIPDFYETNLYMFNGVKLSLDKENADTDGDGLMDGEEVGELQFQYNMDSRKVLVTTKVLSNPMAEDTDLDGISDKEEIVIETDRCNVDTDSDGLLDGIEYVEGFDPLEPDADGDGRRDWLEYAENTDPYVYNKDWNEYMWEFMCGVIAGDFIADSDSFATTAGQVLGSFVPYVDVRDVLGNCVHEDYLMASISLAGLIPVGGDGTKAVAKVGKYIFKNVNDIEKVVELLTFINKHFPEVAKMLGKSDDFILAVKQISKTENLKLTRSGRKILNETIENAGLSQYLIKTSNKLDLKETVNIGAEVWEEGPCKRGTLIDVFINKHNGVMGLGVNFPVADRINNRILISTKSIDLAAQSYQNPRKLKGILNKYANDLKNIEINYFDKVGEFRWGNSTVLSIDDYDSKALEIVLPDTIITENMATILNEFKSTMEKDGLEIWYRITQ